MKILVVFTGGTIECDLHNGVLTPDTQRSHSLINMYSLKKDDTKFEIVQPYNILSENLASEHLIRLYSCIKSHYSDDTDGIIVAHGTDTLQYTSAFLGYAFSNFAKPIVVVSANYPLNDERSNGFRNFETAVEFIKTKPKCGCYVSYKNTNSSPEIHLATRLLPHLPYSDDVFSVLNRPFAAFCDGKFTANNHTASCKNEIAFDEIALNDKMKVLKISPYPDMTFPLIDSNVKAVLFEGFHSGTLPTSAKNFIEFCRKAKELNVPIFLSGSSSDFSYESKTEFGNLGIISLPIASPIAMYVKLKMLNKEKIFDVGKPCANDFIFKSEQKRDKLA